MTTIELLANKNRNFKRHADKIASQKFLAFNLLKTKTKIAFPTIINGTIGASATDKSPTDKATRHGNKPIKIAAWLPKSEAEIKRTALTIGPVIAC